jgi:hypothetical protein
MHVPNFGNKHEGEERDRELHGMNEESPNKLFI